MNMDKLRELSSGWREQARGIRPSGTWTGDDLADRIEYYADELDALLSAPSVGGWMPIESAPRDGSNVLLLVEALEGSDDFNPLEDDQRSRTIGSWQDEERGWDFVGWNWQQDEWESGWGVPIGWQPLPPPPASGEG